MFYLRMSSYSDIIEKNQNFIKQKSKSQQIKESANYAK